MSQAILMKPFPYQITGLLLLTLILPQGSVILRKTPSEPERNGKRFYH